MIRIRNLYHMLAYAFQALRGRGYKSMETEAFENAADLFAAILALGIAAQARRGLAHEYLERAEELSCLRGRIDVAASLKTQSFLRRRLICSYEEFSVNSSMNRIIKSTVLALLKGDIARDRKRKLRGALAFFNGVEPLDLKTADWNVRYNRNNQTCRMLIGVCRLVAEGLLQTQADGAVKLADFLDEQPMHRLYEKFVLEYFRREFPQIAANAVQIPWQVDDGVRDMLPRMQTDATLTYGGKTLIIDAKYYSRATQAQYGTRTLHSGNLYQIFAYVKNREAELAGAAHPVAGMLLYAATGEDVVPDCEYSMSGNRIAVRTLNLDCDFSIIRAQLNGIAERFLDVTASA